MSKEKKITICRKFSKSFEELIKCDHSWELKNWKDLKKNYVYVLLKSYHKSFVLKTEHWTIKF